MEPFCRTREKPFASNKWISSLKLNAPSLPLRCLDGVTIQQFQDRGGGVDLELFGDGGAPPTRICVLQIRQFTVFPFSCSSTSMYLRHFGLGH
jgi:hypothetical protein